MRSIVLLLLLISPALLHAQDRKVLKHGEAYTGACTPGTKSKDLRANNVTARLYNTGSLFHRDAGTVYEVPAFGGTDAVFAKSIWIGGMVNGELRFAGSDYGPFEFFPGPIDANGNPPEDCTPYDRIYSISRDDIRDFRAGGTPARDLAEWPHHLGAPVIDGDGVQGNYNLAGGDRPALEGHQTAWWILNDAAGEHAWSEAEPLNVEVRTTAFATYSKDPVNNTTFYRYEIVYRGSEPLTDAYFGLFLDLDVGYADDDYSGSDTTLDMVYGYNGDNLDESGYGSAPPAVGVVVLDGVMTGYVAYEGGDGPRGDPENAEEAYGYLRGIWRDGTLVTVGGNGYGGTSPTRFMYPGDPVTRSFWSEMDSDNTGKPNTPRDIRGVMSIGPFSMKSGDVQEILVAVVWSRGTDHLDSVTQLREDVAFVKAAYQDGSLYAYPMPARTQAPELEITGDLWVRIGHGETKTRVIKLSNTGTALLEWSYLPPPSGIKRFITVANAAGPLNPPDQAAFALGGLGFPTTDGKPPSCSSDQSPATCNDRPTHSQQTGPGRWGINASESRNYESYLRRTLGLDEQRLGPYDYEWRFTGTSTAAMFQNQTMTVPFEIWRTGVATPDDRSDDVRMIPHVTDWVTLGQFAIWGDHPLLTGSNDPFSDQVTWYLPEDTTPGESGYQAEVERLLAGTYSLSFSRLILDDQVLISMDGGFNEPFNQPLPEDGTIFRIETHKSWTKPSLSWGRLEQAQSVEIELPFGQFLPGPGVYHDTLRFATSVPETPVIKLPFTLEVTAEPTGIASSEQHPSKYSLHQNYPNPFNPTTTIRFDLPETADIRLAVYDVIGRLVDVLVEETRPAGRYEAAFEAGGLPAGLYFYSLEAGPYREVKPMLLVK